MINLGSVEVTDGVLRGVDHTYVITALSAHGIGLGSTDEDDVRCSTYEWNGTKFLIVTEAEKTSVFLPREYKR